MICPQKALRFTNQSIGFQLHSTEISCNLFFFLSLLSSHRFESLQEIWKSQGSQGFPFSSWFCYYETRVAGKELTDSSNKVGIFQIWEKKLLFKIFV